MNRVSKFTQHLTTSSNNNIHSSSTSSSSSVKKVLVTGAAGNIAYAILFAIGRGELLGKHQRIELRLLDLPSMKNKMRGVLMELQDCAFPLLTKIIATVDYKTAFADAEIALLIGAKPRSKGQLRSDLLKENASIFQGQGRAIDQWSNKNIRVVVVGNPANTNCLITLLNAPSINPRNFTAMMRLDQNRAVSQIAQKINCPVSNIHNIIVWGNHSKTQFPDVSYAKVIDGKSGNSLIKNLVSKRWLTSEFVPNVQKRGSAIIDARGLSSAASAANACLDHIRTWLAVGTKDGEMVSMAVMSNGEYGIPKGIIYSFPCTCDGRNGEWSIVRHLKRTPEAREKMVNSAQELLKERDIAIKHLA